MLRIGKLSSQRTKVISISEAGRRQSRQHAPELESVGLLKLALQVKPKLLKY